MGVALAQQQCVASDGDFSENTRGSQRVNVFKSKEEFTRVSITILWYFAEAVTHR